MSPPRSREIDAIEAVHELIKLVQADLSTLQADTLRNGEAIEKLTVAVQGVHPDGSQSLAMRFSEAAAVARDASASAMRKAEEALRVADHAKVEAEAQKKALTDFKDAVNVEDRRGRWALVVALLSLIGTVLLGATAIVYRHGP